MVKATCHVGLTIPESRGEAGEGWGGLYTLRSKMGLNFNPKYQPHLTLARRELVRVELHRAG